MENIPGDVLRLVLLRLPLLDAFRLQRLCRRIQLIVDDLMFWSLLESQFASPGDRLRDSIQSIIRHKFKSIYLNQKIATLNRLYFGGKQAVVEFKLYDNSLHNILVDHIRELHKLQYQSRLIQIQATSVCHPFRWLFRCSECRIDLEADQDCCVSSGGLKRKWGRAVERTITYSLTQSDRHSVSVAL
jgi:hypothetical protein